MSSYRLPVSLRMGELVRLRERHEEDGVLGKSYMIYVESRKTNLNYIYMPLYLPLSPIVL